MKTRECYARPVGVYGDQFGAWVVIDTIDPVTGLTSINGKTPEEVFMDNPKAERMTMESFRAKASMGQHTPITWNPTTCERFEEMLGAVPPAAMRKGAFLQGEAMDHDYATGEERCEAYRYERGTYYVSSRPMTLREFDTELTRLERERFAKLMLSTFTGAN